MTLESPFRWLDVGLFVNRYESYAFHIGVFFGVIVIGVLVAPGVAEFVVFNDGVEARPGARGTLVRFGLNW